MSLSNQISFVPPAKRVEYHRITKELCLAMVKLVGRRMLFESEACAMLGINRDSWQKWKSRHRNNEWVKQQIEKMRGEKIDKALERIEKSADGEDLKQPDWRAAAWIAEKTSPERFGSRQIEPVQNNTLNVQVMLDSVRRVFARAPSAPARALLPAPDDNVVDVEERPRRAIPRRKPAKT